MTKKRVTDKPSKILTAASRGHRLPPFAVTESEKEATRDAARELSVSVSEFVRMAIRNEIARMKKK